MGIEITVLKDISAGYDAFKVRRAVFVDEQGFFDKLDRIDDIAYHAVAYDRGKPVGCGRMFPESDKEFHVGRIAVLKEYRSMGIGTAIMRAFEKTASDCGAEYIILSAQSRAYDFYLNLGYEFSGDEYSEEGYPHTLMKKKL